MTPLVTPTVLPPKLAVINTGLQSSPLLKRILLNQQGQSVIGILAQANLDTLLGLIDGEIAIRNLPPESRDEQRDLINPDAPAVIPGETVLPE